MDANDKRLSFLPLEKATVPPSGLVEHIKDHWWAVHPEKGLVFYGASHAAQANANQFVAEEYLPKMYPWCEVKLIPSVFRRINPKDYC